MRNFQDHLLFSGDTIKQALIKLNNLAKDAILFVIDNNEKLIGTLTDGDVRRGLIKGIDINDSVDLIIEIKPKYIRKGNSDINKIIEYRKDNLKILPIIDENNKVINVLNFRNSRSYLPIDAIIMAGGEGQRLRPLTNSIPKPLLKIGNKAIIDHNFNRLMYYGIDDFWICIKYLGKHIEAHFNDRNLKNININYVREDKPLGTIGGVSKIEKFIHDYILIINSDILTNLDFESFFIDFIERGADFSIVTIPYKVEVPYAVLKTLDERVIEFSEKPTYTYYSNGGIYLLKKEHINLIPKDECFNATDLIEKLILNNNYVVSYPFSGYWLDIGKPDDFNKAQNDIKNINFEN